MRTASRGMLLAVLAVWLTGCVAYRAPFMVPRGAIFSKTRAPLGLDFDHVPVAAASGSASLYYVDIPQGRGMANIAWDESAIARAAAAGNLRTVAYADYEYLQVLGVFCRMTVTAYGEPVR